MAYSLFETAELGPLISKNRTVRSATNEHLSDPSGQITPAWVDSLEALARGGVGIIITGHLSVDRDQRADEGQAVLDQETDPALLSLAAQRVHQHGALLIAQISHSGGKARPGVNGGRPSPPAISRPSCWTGWWNSSAMRPGRPRWRALMGSRSTVPTIICSPAS